MAEQPSTRHTGRHGHAPALQGQHDQALREFRWPDVGERFNWAIDLVRRHRPRQRRLRTVDRRGGRL